MHFSYQYSKIINESVSKIRLLTNSKLLSVRVRVSVGVFIRRRVFGAPNGRYDVYRRYRYVRLVMRCCMPAVSDRAQSMIPVRSSAGNSEIDRGLRIEDYHTGS